MIKRILKLFLVLSFYTLISISLLYGKGKLTSDLVDTSITLSGEFLLNNQKPAGNFYVYYNIKEKQYIRGDYQFYQAYALYGLTQLYIEDPSDEKFTAVQNGLSFFIKNSVETTDSRKFIVYPADSTGHTGTVAFVALSISELLNSGAIDDKKLAEKYRNELDMYMNQLVSLRQKETGVFTQKYTVDEGKEFQNLSTPRYDGPALLAMISYQDLTEDEKFIPMILQSADSMYKSYYKLSAFIDNRYDLTVELFPWICRAFYEIYIAKWTDNDLIAGFAKRISEWAIDEYDILKRNDAGAGIALGLGYTKEIMEINSDKPAAKKIDDYYKKLLYKVIRLQAGSGIEYRNLRKIAKEKHIKGGVLTRINGELMEINNVSHLLGAGLFYKETH